MKQILKNKIINIDNNIEDKKFLIKKLDYEKNILDNDFEVFFLSDFLEKRKNEEMFEKAKIKPGVWSNVYSPKDELEIFEELFSYAIRNNKKIHIVGVTLGEEIKLLEDYYKKLGFFDEEINAFKVNFSKVLVSVSIKIENIMWRGSDYKRLGKKIFFNPPVRESGEVKNMFKGINRGVIAGIYFENFDKQKKDFLQEQVEQEKILAITLSKVLNYNLLDFGFSGDLENIIINY